MLYLVVNKFSGSYSEKKISTLESTVRAYFQNYVFVDTIISDGKVSVNIDANKIEQKDIITAVGGDGTINACLQFIHINGLQEKVTLGIIPLGTGNNMLRSLGLSKSFRKSAEILQKGKTEKISYGTVNGDKAFFNCSLGFTSFVLQKRKTNSIAGYFYDTIRLLPSFKGSKIRFLNEEKSIDIFAGFFINTKIYMSRFKFLKVNNSESKLIFFYIKKNNIFKTIATVSLAFFGFNVYDKTEKEKYAVELDDNCELELDGDILKFPDNNRTLIIGNESYIDIIKG